ncbi:MAG: phosphoribosylglycinamide formyltransferase [Clostridiales bacterium]|nr:phosphoribosylglycinamide formyltransferase [Clostridiales bacterium]
MKKINIAVLVSGGGTNLQALIDAKKSGIIKHGKLTLVIADNPEAYAINRAEIAGIPVCVIPKKGCRDKAEFEGKILKELKRYDIDLIVLAGFMNILSADFVSRYPDRIINVHPSLIPSFCGQGFYGIKVHEAALRYGVKVTGATVHYVNEIPDGGKIISQKAIKIRECDTPETLQHRVMENAEWVILPKAVETVSKELLNKGKNKGVQYE